MTTFINAATTTTGVSIDPAVGDGTLTLKTGATAGAQVNAVSFAADGTPTLLKPLQGNSLTSGTAQNTTSGTSIDFTGIPSWVKRITVMLGVVSTNGTSIPMIQIGDSEGIENTGYLGTAFYGVTSGSNATQNSTGFLLSGIASAASYTYSGIYTLSLLTSSSNTWVFSGSSSSSDAARFYSGSGVKSTSATLDRIRLTTVNGTDTFDAGSVNILYEG